MKSRKIFITIIAAAAVFVSGCSKFLDVHPKGEKINMFETAEEYEDALYGVYNELTGANLYGQYIYLLPEVLSQNFTTSDYKYSELAEGEMTTQGATATKRDIWKSAYTAVNHINNIVEHAEDDIDTYKHSGLYLGEALALRALVHFELLKLFGPPYWASEAEKNRFFLMSPNIHSTSRILIPTMQSMSPFSPIWEEPRSILPRMPLLFLPTVTRPPTHSRTQESLT